MMLMTSSQRQAFLRVVALVLFLPSLLRSSRNRRTRRIRLSLCRRSLWRSFYSAFCVLVKYQTSRILKFLLQEKPFLLQEAQNDLKALQASKKAQKAKAKGKASEKAKEDDAPQEKTIESHEKDSDKGVGKAKANSLKSRRSSKQKEVAGKLKASKAVSKTKAARASTPKMAADASGVEVEPEPSDKGEQDKPKKRKYDVVVPTFRTCEVVPYGTRNEAGLKLKKPFITEDKKVQAIHCEF
jgi:hypothetical protein